MVREAKRVSARRRDLVMVEWNLVHTFLEDVDLLYVCAVGSVFAKAQNRA